MLQTRATVCHTLFTNSEGYKRQTTNSWK